MEAVEEAAASRRRALNPLEAFASTVSLITGLAVGLSGSHLAAGLFFTAALSAYILASRPSVRLPLALAMFGTQAGHVVKLKGSVVLPFIVIERGVAGSSIYPDLAQIILAYELIRRYPSHKRNSLKPGLE
ncbi:hypothetical protein [Stetteria hydrogenophila]